MLVYDIRKAIAANGGTPRSFTPIGSLRELVATLGGTATKYDEVGLWRQIVAAVGATPASWTVAGLARQYVQATGGTASFDLGKLGKAVAAAVAVPPGQEMPQLASPVMAWSGNSLVAQGLNSDATFGTYHDMRGVWNYMRGLDGARIDIPIALVKGVGGQTAAQIMARLPGEVTAAAAAGAGLFGAEMVTNDATDPATPLADTIARVDAAIAAVRAAGMVWASGNGVFRADFAVGSDQVAKMDAYAAALLARHNPAGGVVIADTYGATRTAQLGTGARPLRSADNLHLTSYGSWLYSSVLLAALVATYGAQLPARDLFARPGTILGPALTASVSGLPTGATATLDNGRVRIDLTGAGAAGEISLAQTWAFGAITPGASYVEMIQPFSFANCSGIRQARIDTTAYKSGYSPLQGLLDGAVGTANPADGAVFPPGAFDWLARTPRVLMPADATRLATNSKLTLLAGATGTVWIGRAGLTVS